MKSKHTPGPWSIKKIRGVQIVAKIGVVEQAPLADLTGNNTEENAHLIAAAPEMFEQLRTELNWLMHIRGQIQAPESVMLGFDQAIKNISQTINKAKGE